MVPTEDIKDTAVAAAVKNAVERRLGTRAQGVTVHVERGVVTLSGRVSNKREQDAVREVVTATRGVNALQDETEIET